MNELRERFGTTPDIFTFIGPGKFRGIEGYVFYLESKPIDVFIPHGFVFTNHPDGIIEVNG